MDLYSSDLTLQLVKWYHVLSYSIQTLLQVFWSMLQAHGLWRLFLIRGWRNRISIVLWAISKRKCDNVTMWLVLLIRCELNSNLWFDFWVLEYWKYLNFEFGLALSIHCFHELLCSRKKMICKAQQPKCFIRRKLKFKVRCNFHSFIASLNF
jgi:hypothetical protein